MSDETHKDGSSEIVPVNRGVYPDETQTVNRQDLDKQHLEDLAREVLELKLATLSDSDHYGREVEKLRNQFIWLTGIFILAIAILGGTLAWVTFTLKSTQEQLVERVDSVTANRVRVEQIEELEENLRSLQEQLPESIARDVATNQEQLSEVQADLNSLQRRVTTRQETLGIFLRALQDLVSESTPEASAPAEPETPEPQATQEEQEPEPEADSQ
jgi:uncharacterized protein YPO0396